MAKFDLERTFWDAQIYKVLILSILLELVGFFLPSPVVKSYASPDRSNFFTGVTYVSGHLESMIGCPSFNFLTPHLEPDMSKNVIFSSTLWHAFSQVSSQSNQTPGDFRDLKTLSVPFITPSHEKIKKISVGHVLPSFQGRRWAENAKFRLKGEICGFPPSNHTRPIEIQNFPPLFP